jgi:hypothetical protein
MQQRLLPEHVPLFAPKNFKDGCVVVQMVDHRDLARLAVPPQNNDTSSLLSSLPKQSELSLNTPQITSFVLRPTSGTLQADITTLLVNENMQFSEKVVFDVESKLLVGSFTCF